MLFSVLAVVGGRPENTFMLFWIKNKQTNKQKTPGPFFDNKKGQKSFPLNYAPTAHKMWWKQCLPTKPRYTLSFPQLHTPNVNLKT